MARIYLSLNTGSGQYGDCVQEERCLIDVHYHPQGHTEDRLWVIKRKLKPWGHFATAMINGTSMVIDGSLPTRVDKLPRDAKLVSREDNARLWHEDNESHVFGGPNVAKALREQIARDNAAVAFARGEAHIE